MAVVKYVATAGVLRRLSGGVPSVTAPSPPSLLGVVAGDTTLAVSWVAPTSNGGSAVTGYTVNAYKVSDGTSAGSVTGIGPSTFTATVTGLTDGTPVFAKVTVTNAIGSATSPSSATVTPLATGGGGASTDGYGGNPGGWHAVGGVTCGVPLGLSGTDFYGNAVTDTRTPITLVTPASVGLSISGGAYRITGAAHDFHNVAFDNTVTLQSAGALFRFYGCQFKGLTISPGGAPQPALVNGSLAGMISPEFYDCEFDGNGVWANAMNPTAGLYSGEAPGAAISYSGSALSGKLGFKVVRCWIRHLNHGLGMTSINGATVDSCHIEEPIQYFDNYQNPVGTAAGRVSHNDGIQIFGGNITNVNIINSRIDNYNHVHGVNGNTSCLQFGSNFSSGTPLTDILIDSNLLEGGGYMVNGLGSSAYIGTTSIARFTFTNQRFGLNCIYGPLTTPTHDSRITYSNNSFAKTGTLGSGVSVIKGQLIP